VIDEMKKPFRPGLFIGGSILSALEYGEELNNLQNHEFTYLIDAQNNMMTVTEEIMVTIRVQKGAK